MRIPTKLHGVADYSTAAMLLAAPALLRQDVRSAAIMRAVGGGILATSLLTDYELGVRRRVPMPVHLALDAACGAVLAAAPWVLGTARRGPREWLPGVLVGVGELAGAALTERTPGDRRQGATAARTEQTAPAGSGTLAGPPTPPRAVPPLETPGPSVNAPRQPESETERAERADALTHGSEFDALDAADPAVAEALLGADPEVAALFVESTLESRGEHDLVSDEEAAAAMEAREIGGPRTTDSADPAMDAVYQAGGGEREGFELAEDDLIRNATHDAQGANPLRDAFAPEVESDASGAEYGEADDLPERDR